jgi:cephalosporin hydroxylase
MSERVSPPQSGFEERLALARRNIRERAFVPALHLSDELLAMAPASLAALELRMHALREVGRFEMACDVARQMISLDAGNQRAEETLSLLSSALAKPVFETAASLDRSFASEIPHAFMLRIQQSVHHYRYKGIQMVKDPFDIALYPMLLWELRPRTLIEVGSKSGGSGLWFGDQMKTFGIEGHVYSIDVVPVRGLDRDNVTFMEGNGRELEKVLSRELLETLPRPWLVIEDADHSYETSLAVLRFFHPYLMKGEYIVVEDGIISDLYPESCPNHSSGPHLALKEFLAQEGESYTIDPNYCDFFGRNVTWATNGFLERVA